jgi:peroxiredoxin
MLPALRPLLSTKTDFVWCTDLQEKFDLAKRSLAEAPVLSYFDPRKPTHVCTDASCRFGNSSL